MALAEYQYGDRTFLFEDDAVPAGAVRVPKHVAPEPSAKEAPAPSNKARKAADK